MNHIVRGRKRVLGIALALVVLLALLLAACGGDDDGNGDGNGDNGGEPAGSTTQPADNPDAADTGTTPEIGPPLTPVATEPPPPPNTPVGPPDQESFQNAADWASADLASRLDVSITLVAVLEPETPFLMDAPPVCPEVDADITDLQYVYVQHERLIYPYQYYVLAEPDPDTGEALVVQACDDVLVDEDVLYVPTPDARAAILTQVEADLLARNVDPTRGQFRTVRKMTWFDTKLGCPLKAYEGEEATPAAIDGYLVIYELDGVEYEYHTDLTGEWIQFCEPPTGYASIEAFAFTLANKGDYDFVRLEDEVARYDGLDRDGLLVGLTPREYRVGLFEFETPQAAQLAAGQIDDEDVSHIYTAGYVLVVQEENSLDVYGILSQYADEVRAPVMERQEAEATAQALEDQTLDEETDTLTDEEGDESGAAGAQ